MKKLTGIIISSVLFIFAGCGKEKKIYSIETYHKIHVEKLNIECGTCHASEKYASGEYYLNKYEIENDVALKKIPGVIDKNACIGCHRGGSIGPEFYGKVWE